MKFRISTKYATSFPLNGMLHDEYITSVIDTCNSLSWKILFISNHGIIANTNKGMFAPNQEITVRREGDTLNILSASTGNELHDWGRNEKTVSLFINTFNEIKETVTPEHVAVTMNEWHEKIAVAEADVLSPTLYADFKKGGNILSVFVPREEYFITPILLWLNIAIFIAMCISGVSIITPEAESIYKWGGNYGPVTLNGQWWRILTCSFIHIGIVHLLMNMYALMFIGLMLEPKLGKTRFTAVYFFTAITSSLMSLYIHPEIVSAGASGAIFGLFGVYIALLTTNVIDKETRKQTLPTMGIYVLYNLVYGMKEGIDNAGHIGGLIGGLVAGYAMLYSIRNYDRKGIKYAVVSILALVTLGFAVFVLNTLPNPTQKKQEDIVLYQEKVKKFAEYESMALEIYTLSDSTPKEKMLSAIKDKGIYYWDECTKVLNEIDTLDVPDETIQTNKQIKEYCALRKETYELLYKKVAEKTDIYNDKITSLDSAVQSKLATLNEQHPE